jgi:hypothetical protein
MLQMLGSQHSSPLQDRGHDREVARSNHTHTPVAGEVVELDVVTGAEPAGANDNMHPRAYRGQHVLLDCVGAGVIEEHINLRGLQRFRHRGIDGPVASRRCRLGQRPPYSGPGHPTGQGEAIRRVNRSHDRRRRPAGDASETNPDHDSTLMFQGPPPDGCTNLTQS